MVIAQFQNLTQLVASQKSPLIVLDCREREFRLAHQFLAPHYPVQHLRSGFANRGTAPARPESTTSGTTLSSVGRAAETARGDRYSRGIAQQALAGGHIRRFRP